MIFISRSLRTPSAFFSQPARRSTSIVSSTISSGSGPSETRKSDRSAVEPLSWKELRDESGYIHDLIVDPGARGRNLGSLLLEAACDWLRDRGMPRVVLGTAAANEAAQRLFTRAQFRPTMIEMTREL